MKKLLASLLCVMMVFCMMPGMAFAEGEPVVAKIGETTYTSFSAAMDAANAMTGDVVVEICGEVEFVNGMELNGSYSSITFNKGADGAKITINQTAGGDYLTAHGKTVAFNDLTLAKANPAWSGNSGHMGNYFSIQGGTVTYTNCTFPNGACTSGGTATYTGCTFQNSVEYGLWVYDDALVTVNGGTIDSKKGIKVYSEGEDSVTSTLTVQNATFTENVSDKPAVAVGYAESITLIGNTYNNTTGVLELDSGSDADCEGVTFVAQDASGNDISSTLTAVDRSNSNAPCGVLMDGKIYTTVTTAKEAAEAGDTVTLLYDTDETVDFGEDVIVDTNGKNASGVLGAAAVAQIGAKGYTSLQAAFADATTPGVVIELLDDVTYDVAAWNNNAFGPTNGTITINGNNHKITFNHTNSDWNNVVTNGATLVIKNASISNSGHNDGPWNRHDINFGCNVELENVTSDKAIALKAGGKLTNVTISDANTSDTYAIWIQPNGQDVVLDVCTIDMLACSDGRGIKIDNQYLDTEGKPDSKPITLSVKNTTFKTEEKSAILVKAPAGATITASNVNISEVAADTKNLVWLDEAYKNDEAAKNAVTVTGANFAHEGGQEVITTYTPPTPPTPPASSGGYYPVTTPLMQTQTAAKAAVADYVKAADYTAEAAAEIVAIVDQAKKDITAAKTVDEVKAIEAAAKAEIDTIETAAEEAEIAAIEATKFKARSKMTKLNGKKAIKVTWNAPDELNLDGYQVFRSVKRYSGFGTKPIWTTAKTTYTNNKGLESGKTYYYKVRGYKVVNDELVYTEWSYKAWRTVE